MEVLLKFFDDLVTAGGVSKPWIVICLVIAAFGVLFFYLMKAYTHLNTYLKSPENTVSKSEIESIKTAVKDDNRAIFQILDDVRERIKNLEKSGDQAIELNQKLENELDKINNIVSDMKHAQLEEIPDSAAARQNLTALVIDSKAQYVEVSRQVQALQKDLASLHGTIIGMGTQRTRLK